VVHKGLCIGDGSEDSPRLCWLLRRRCHTSLIATVEATPEKIVSLLSPMIGEPLSDMWRALGQIFEFGEQKPFVNHKGEEATQADFHFKALSDWSLSQDGVLIMNAYDHRGKRRFYHRIRKPTEPEKAVRWSRANAFFDQVYEGSLVLNNISVTDGVVRLELDLGYLIEVRSDDDWFYFSSNRDGSSVLADSKSVLITT
jgi:hypothetical protein